jgi:fibronectin type 3 domain-containing protein
MALAIALPGARASAQVSVLTQHNDNQRTGANLQETILTPANVNATQFGKLFTCPVDGQIYAQPLYVPNLAMPWQGTHNVVFVATMNNSIYAFDADQPGQTQPLWQTTLRGPMTQLPNGQPYDNIIGPIGIVSTPVIDPNTNTLYAVCTCAESTSGPYHQYLYAIDITTGKFKLGSPVEIQGSVAYTVTRSTGPAYTVLKTFNPGVHMNRPALLLDHGAIYIAFGSHGDINPYNGWVFAYDAATLNQVGIYCPTLHCGQGAIWQGGQGPAADAQGNVYMFTANGGDYPATGDHSNSAVKLSLSGGGLGLADWFTPYNEVALTNADEDLSSSGPMLLPGTSYLVGGGKECKIYVLDTNNMGQCHYNAQDQITDTDDSRIVQSFPADGTPWTLGGQTHHIHGSPVTFTGPANQQLIYVWPENDLLYSYQFSNGQFITTPYATSTFKDATGMPGGFLSISANGSDNGILWVNRPLSDAMSKTAPGCMEAFDAVTLQLLYDTRTNANDNSGNFAKFVPPTVANGKVYLATFSNNLAVYGLYPPTTAVTLSASTISAYEVDLSWPTAVANATNYSIERSVDGTNFAPVAIADDSASFYKDKSCSGSTTYYYRVRAFNSGGYAPSSNVVTVATVTGKPAARNLTAKATAWNEIDLSWDLSNYSSVKVMRSGDTVHYGTIAQLATNATQYADTHITASTKYYYKVVVTNASGNSPYSNVAAAVTLPKVPSAPSGLKAATISQTEIDLTWQPGASGVGGYAIDRSTDGVNYIPLINVGASVTSYKNKNCSPSMTYTYRVKAYNGGSYSAYSNPATATTPPNVPAQPSNLTAKVISQTEIDLSWTNNATTQTGFILLRSTDDQNFSQVGTAAASATTYADTSCAPNTTYYYEVEAYNAGGPSLPATTIGQGTTPPYPPTTPVLTVSKLTYNGVTLSWAVTGVNISTYIQQSSDGMNFSTIKSVGGITSWTVTPLSANTTYYFQVYCTNRGGSSANSNIVTAVTLNTTPKAPSGLTATAASQTEVDLAWINNATNAASNSIQRSPDSSTWTTIASIDPSQTSYADTSVAAGTTYYYRVVAVNNGGTGASSGVKVSTPPNPPSTPSLTAQTISRTEIDLTWTAPQASVVIIERSTNGTSFSQLTSYSASKTVYKDTQCSNGTTYYYRMRSQNAGGLSSYSAVISATTQQ